MFKTLEEFYQAWGYASQNAMKAFNALTDESLNQPVTENDDRTLGSIAWHVATTIQEMISRTGLAFASEFDPESPVPTKASEIAATYQKLSDAMIAAMKEQWTDATLLESCDMYGDQWLNGLTLDALIGHQTHHLGQATILMRQAGLKVPGLFGPSREEMEAMFNS